MIKVTREKLPIYDLTRSFGLALSIGLKGLGKVNNQLFILYVYVLKYGWCIDSIRKRHNHYEVWIAKQGEDCNKCVNLRF